MESDTAQKYNGEVTTVERTKDDGMAICSFCVFVHIFGIDLLGCLVGKEL